jgi:23S rRNA (pseudouridine1915-N3)-methyltransferase
MQVNLTRAHLVVVGALDADRARLAADYERRLSRYVRLEVTEIKAEPVQRGAAIVLRAEGERMLAHLDKISQRTSGTVEIVALDSRGKTLSTEELAERWLAPSELVILIGGTLGLAPDVLARATSRLSFGRITLPHQLARIIATEQLYRAFRIARGEPYHF